MHNQGELSRQRSATNLSPACLHWLVLLLTGLYQHKDLCRENGGLTGTE